MSLFLVRKSSIKDRLQSENFLSFQEILGNVSLIMRA